MFEALKIYTNTSIDEGSFKRGLVDFGYQPTNLVNQQGDFASRGNIIDVYSATYDNPTRIELDTDKVESIFTFDVNSGKPIDYLSMLIVLPIRRAGLGKFKGSTINIKSPSDVDNFTEVSSGDYVVHIRHGIGRYLGIEKLKTQDGFRDYLSIEYADGDKLYVPSDRMYLVQKYVGFEGRHYRPRLYKLGSKEWQKTKRKVKEGIEILASQLLQLQALRSALGGFEFSKDHPWQSTFEETFPYKETPDQIRSMNEIKKDMESPKPMDRLVCGDVGYGKTEVAFRAAFKAIMDNKQVAILVPTTILAQQHFNNLKRRVENFPIEVKVLSRFNSNDETKEILSGLKSGKVDIVIGTHRLLSKDTVFKDLGLVIIDEEQRFGVRHKEKLKTLRLLVDVLTLTATPIPRTLYMSLAGVKDLSLINTPPQDRIPIETYVLEYDEQLIRRVIIKELQRDGQVYFIHNRVRGIEQIKKRLECLVPEATIKIAHGQMFEKELEETMAEFINGKIDVLLSTNIVESGLDIPNVNTIIVNRADMFGLSDLYQLRGRVGRISKRAYCYFLILSRHTLDGRAKRRLEVIEKFTDLGSGFKIAMEDLEIRGTGNLLGQEQHGYITAVGFDLYSRLLKSSIEKLNRTGLKDYISDKFLLKTSSN